MYNTDPNDPFAPLNPDLPNTQLYVGARPGFGLRDAHASALSQARQTATPRSASDQPESPFAGSINSAKKMAAMTLSGANLSQDEQDQLTQLANDPGVSPATFESMTRMLRQRAYTNQKQIARQPMQHTFDAPDPQSQPQGSISIAPSEGPGGMDADTFAAGQARVQQSLTPGENMTQNDGGGYTVSGGALNPEQATSPQDAIVDLYNSVKQRLTPDQQAQWKATAQSGATAQQLDALTRDMTKPSGGTREQSFNVRTEAQRYQLGQIESELKSLGEMFPGIARGSQISIAGHPEQAARFKTLMQQKQSLLQQIQSLSGNGAEATPEDSSSSDVAPQYDDTVTHEGAQRYTKTARNPQTGERLGLTPEGQWVKI